MNATNPITTPVRPASRRPPAKLSASGLRYMLNLGMRVGKIAAMTGYARSTITRHLKAYGIDPESRRGPPPKLPPVSEIVARIQAGERPIDIARSAGAHPSAVHLSLYRAGLRLDRGRVLPKES